MGRGDRRSVQGCVCDGEWLPVGRRRVGSRRQPRAKTRVGSGVPGLGLWAIWRFDFGCMWSLALLPVRRHGAVPRLWVGVTSRRGGCGSPRTPAGGRCSSGRKRKRGAGRAVRGVSFLVEIWGLS